MQIEIISQTSTTLPNYFLKRQTNRPLFIPKKANRSWSQMCKNYNVRSGSKLYFTKINRRCSFFLLVPPFPAKTKNQRKRAFNSFPSELLLMGGHGPKPESQWVALSVTVALASLSASTAISIYLWGRKSNGDSKKKIEGLEASLKSALQNCAAERQGRIRAQKALREAVRSRQNSDNLDSTSYPMTPIGVINSCFSTRNGTPRQPLLVPLARASLILDSSRAPQASLEGLDGYSHCWIIFVFHLNTDLEKLWKHPSQSKLKAKVRVPSLKGERMGVFATRSPHRPCPIGLTVAKVEAVQGHKVLLSGADLVDGTPVLDIKPYLPYCDNIPGATVPDWVKADNVLAIASVNFSEDFSSSLAACWLLAEKKSLYASPEEFKSLIRQVLSWDIRSVSQRIRPHQPAGKTEEAGSRSDDDLENRRIVDDASISPKDEAFGNGGEVVSSSLSSDIIYHLILEGLDVSYRIDSDANVLVENVALTAHYGNKIQ